MNLKMWGFSDDKDYNEINHVGTLQPAILKVYKGKALGEVSNLNNWVINWDINLLTNQG